MLFRNRRQHRIGRKDFCLQQVSFMIKLEPFLIVAKGITTDVADPIA